MQPQSENREISGSTEGIYLIQGVQVYTSLPKVRGGGGVVLGT